MKHMQYLKTRLAVCGILVSTTFAYGVDYVSSIGGSGNWTTGGNWTPAAPAGGPDIGYWRFSSNTPFSSGNNAEISAGDTVTLNHGTSGGGAYAATGNNQDRLGLLDSTLTISGGILNLSGGSTVVGGNGFDGTFNVNAGTVNFNGGGGSLRLAYGSSATAVGRLTIGDGVGAPGSAHLNIFSSTGLRTNEGGGSSQAIIVINNDGRLSMGGQVIGTGLAGSANTSSITMNGGQIDQGWAVIAGESGTVSTVTMNDGALWVNPSAAAYTEIGRNGGTGHLELNDTAEFRMTRNDSNSANSLRVGGGGAASTGFVTVNDNAHLNISNQPLTIGLDGQGTVTQNGGRVTVGQSIFMGRNIAGSATTAKGTYQMNGGILTVGDDIRIGISTLGVFDQQGGDVTVNSEILFGDLGAGTGAHTGTYNLEGGVLRVDRIVADSPVSGGAGHFNWGGGTLTVQETIGGSGTTDYTATAIHGQAEPSAGVEVRSGTTLDFVADGTLATGFNGGNSTLDLGGVYLNTGVRFNNLDVTGTLDLGAGLTLSAINSPYFLRPFGAFSEDYGSIPLIVADEITGFTGNDAQELINFLGVADDGKGFSEYLGVYVGHSSLGENQWFLEFRDEADAATFGLGSGTVDLVLFNYRIKGTVPEPSSFMLLGCGFVFVRALRRKAPKA